MKTLRSMAKQAIGTTTLNYIRAYRSKYFPSHEDKGEFDRRKAFYGSFLKPGDLYFDVGANIGNRIAPILEIGAKVVAVEPQESCYKVLKSVFGDKITLVTEGLSDKEEVKEFYMSEVTVVSSFSKDWIDSVKERFPNYKWDKVTRIKMTTLDNLIKKFGAPRFIKIDVEGYELEVLKGLSVPVDYISFEYTVPEQTDKVIGCISHIQQNDPNIECNYSIGESMEYAMPQWLSADDMKQFVTQAKFIDTRFGDVYVRRKR